MSATFASRFANKALLSKQFWGGPARIVSCRRSEKTCQDQASTQGTRCSFESHAGCFTLATKR